MPAARPVVSRDQLLVELGFSGEPATASLINNDSELSLASGDQPSAILTRYRALERKLRKKEEDLERLKVDNTCLRKELASMRQGSTTSTPQNADNRALVKTQMKLLKREITSQRQTLAEYKRKEEWMKKCLTWSDRFRDTNRSPVRTFGSSRYARVSSAHLPKELARIPPPKEDEMSLRAAETFLLEVDEEVLEIERICRERIAQRTQSPSSEQHASFVGAEQKTKMDINKDQEVPDDRRTQHSETGGGSQAEDDRTREHLRKLTEKYKTLRKLYDKARGDLERSSADSSRVGSGGEQTLVTDFTARTKSDLQELRELVVNELRKCYGLLEERSRRMETAADDRVKRLLLKLAEETKKRRELHNIVQELRGNIRVFVRVRPLLEKERAEGHCVEFPDVNTIQIFSRELQTAKKWEFDKVFNDKAGQADVFSELQPLIISALDGYNVCIFAYGQTGSGKTHTMQGTSNEAGVYHRTLKELFEGIEARRGGWSYRLTASVVEIYNEEIRDLLVDRSSGNIAKPRLTSTDGVPTSHVPGLTWLPVLSPNDVHSMLEKGWEARAVGSTNINEQSSRSHLIVSLKAEIVTPGGDRLTSKINLVDLAGSERLRKSGAVGQRQKEAVAINKSLSALGDVICARVTKSQHVPYRNSVLTSILSESLGGDSKTVMLLQINPAVNSYDESSNSLSFGSRVSAVEMKVIDPRKKMTSS
ncbi:Kinesin-3, putative [Perkinsus marinus ATCC 50983]|uniref:Kinesin-like protein n=1 Tax=Perkinsus marinus (strain ATCC 50983 / TXsc) TaxID=423536 RepID=C5L502_PERM5|nr:Kinesin-3, putative [Perkinsus marinus ATCC 50983]EER08222.1 Kinesin-3, putative [Perkinsus marinus ATCC 50983]|eukprot:XP_002776406.1 Kinesin-3, putative [Perkinsus marinus ATCC 50983]